MMLARPTVSPHPFHRPRPQGRGPAAVLAAALLALIAGAAAAVQSSAPPRAPAAVAWGFR